MNAACRLAVAKTISNENARRDELITEHLPLVRTIALSMQRSMPVHIDLNDLIHAGTMGLFDAATKYSEEKQVTFRTYAQYRIRGAILDSLRQTDCASREVRRRLKKVEAATCALRTVLGRAPTDSEIAASVGIEPAQLKGWMADFRSVARIIALPPVGQEPSSDSVAGPSVTTPRPDQVLMRLELRQKLQLAMATLPGRHREVVHMYYEGDCTMREIGQILGVNESRVSQIHKAALSRMQKALCEKGVSSVAALC